MPKIFVVLDYYLPGYKAGGPIQTIANMVEQLGNSLDFWIFTRDRDAHDTSAYAGVQLDAWNKIGKAHVFYATSYFRSMRVLRKVMRQVAPDIVYLNSFFSRLTIRFLVIRRLGLIPKTPVVIAPRGELSPGPLQIKPVRKRWYISVAFRLGLYRDFVWQASADLEAQEIQRVVGSSNQIKVVPNIALSAWPQESVTPRDKTAGQVRLVFLSRIDTKKNIHHVLNVLSHLRGDVVFDLYGPIKNDAYWQDCLNLIHILPENVRVTYHGAIPHEHVREALQSYHFFVLPTLGENFGHAILEALMAGCPVVVSDQTPWRELQQQQVGWDIPLADSTAWCEILQQCVDMDGIAFEAMSKMAHEYARNWTSRTSIVEQNLSLFTQGK